MSAGHTTVVMAFDTDDDAVSWFSDARSDGAFAYGQGLALAADGTLTVSSDPRLQYLVEPVVLLDSEVLRT